MKNEKKYGIWGNVAMVAFIAMFILLFIMKQFADGSTEAKIIGSIALIAIAVAIISAIMANVYNAKVKKMNGSEYVGNQLKESMQKQIHCPKCRAKGGKIILVEETYRAKSEKVCKKHQCTKCKYTW